MSKKQPPKSEDKNDYKVGNLSQPEASNALVLFGGSMKMLPKELEELGLAGKIEAREIPGICPTWKPVNMGDYMLGRCVSERDVEFPLIDAKTKQVTSRVRTVLVFDTAVPGGFRSVWLGADLRIKMQEPIGKVYQISYQGEVAVGRNANLNPMKSYQVFEIQPADQITEG